jgi:hypothetical protein
MMQILQRHGVEPVTDGVIAADASNPFGYFEWEKIQKGESFTPEDYVALQGKAVKVLNRRLIPFLELAPVNLEFKIYYMMRPHPEIKESHRLWRVAHNIPEDHSTMEDMVEVFATIHNKLSKMQNVTVRFVTFKGAKNAYQSLDGQSS